MVLPGICHRQSRHSLGRYGNSISARSYRRNLTASPDRDHVVNGSVPGRHSRDARLPARRRRSVPRFQRAEPVRDSGLPLCNRVPGHWAGRLVRRRSQRIEDRLDADGGGRRGVDRTDDHLGADQANQSRHAQRVRSIDFARSAGTSPKNPNATCDKAGFSIVMSSRRGNSKMKEGRKTLKASVTNRPSQSSCPIGEQI